MRPPKPSSTPVRSSPRLVPSKPSRMPVRQPHEFLVRHLSGDWGDLDEEDRSLNDAAVIDGSRILSAYTTRKGERLWIITEAADDQGHRLCTTIL